MAADGFYRLNNRKTLAVVITQGGPGACPGARSDGRRIARARDYGRMGS
jgi:hypothetical protein